MPVKDIEVMGGEVVVFFIDGQERCHLRRDTKAVMENRVSTRPKGLPQVQGMT